jgi:hypothetical protein
MEETTEIITIDELNRNLYSASMIRALEQVNPADLLENEETLRARFRATILDHELKQAFWRELALAQKQGRKIKDMNIYHGRCASSYYYNKFLNDVDRIAWLMHPISSYEDKIESILDSTVSRYNEILGMNISCQRSRRVWDEENKKYKLEYYEDTDPKKALVLLQAIKNIEDRVKGATLQKQLTIRTETPPTIEGETAEINMSAVDARLKELESKLYPYKSTPIDVEYTTTSEDEDDNE